MPFVPVTYSTGAPVLRSDGKTQRVACPHLAQWLVVRDALEVFRGRGHLRYFQTQGDSSDSGGTHTCGSASDREHVSMESVMDSREMGMVEYPRLHSLGWPTGKGEHDHGVLPCGDNSCNQYQIDAYWSGYNGLGNGYAGRDPLPKPSVRRTWQEGIAWAQAQMSITSIPTQEDDDMAVTFNISDGTRDIAVAGRIGDVVGVFASTEELQCWQAATAPNPGVINTRQLDLYDQWRNRSTQTTAIQDQIAAIGTPTVSGVDVAAAVVAEVARKLGA